MQTPCNDNPVNVEASPPGLIRRMASILYDSLLLGAVLFLAGLPLPLIPEAMRGSWWMNILTRTYLVSTCLLFFTWFWTHGGQTLGMRAWRLKVVGVDGGPIGWRAAVVRFFGAILSWSALGLGYLWILMDREKLAWHDRMSATRLSLIPKRRAG